jgi:hypothetical protein
MQGKLQRALDSMLLVITVGFSLKKILLDLLSSDDHVCHKHRILIRLRHGGLLILIYLEFQSHREIIDEVFVI